ncbi:MAG: hypothetical protein JWN86_2780 [Planctomycetota bacterium]|nr:hypothetical protein [Planctomycetota bacterium]
MATVRILSVGQCGFDHSQISSQLGRALTAEVVAAGTHEEAIAAIRSSTFDLVLVNRIGDRDGASGLDLIRALRTDPSTSTLDVMLVSNYPQAQAEAVALGALPGFGKSELAIGTLPPALAAFKNRK